MDKNDTIFGMKKDTCLNVVIGVALVGIVLVLFLCLRKKESFTKNVKVVKHYPTFTDGDKTLLVNLYPDIALRNQIDNNVGQLDRLKILIEDSLQQMTGHLYQINKIHIHPAISGHDFVVDSIVYPKKTYALFRFQRVDNDKIVNIPLSADPDFGDGLEELIYSQIANTLPQSNIQQILN